MFQLFVIGDNLKFQLMDRFEIIFSNKIPPFAKVYALAKGVMIISHERCFDFGGPNISDAIIACINASLEVGTKLPISF